MSDQHLIETPPEAFHGERIDRVVSAIAGISRSLAKELIVASKVLVDGRPITTASSPVYTAAPSRTSRSTSGRISLQ